MKIKFEGRVCHNMITDVKISPNNSLIAFGSSNGNIYVHFNEERMHYKQRCVLNQNYGAIRELDFSCNSQYIQSTTQGNSLIYCECGYIQSYI